MTQIKGKYIRIILILESSEDTIQVTDAQGCLKQKLPFWREKLQVPPPII